MDPLQAIGVLGVGLAAGVLSGMFGVGGAVISTPGIRALGTPPLLAVGSTVPAILPGALAGTYRYARAGLVDWRLGLTCGVAGSPLAIAGAATAGSVEARWLMVLTAGLLGVSGVAALHKALGRSSGSAAGASESAGEHRETPVGFVAAAATGAAAGYLAGLLGVGGGVLLMPLFTGVLRIPVRAAAASSLVAVAIFSLPALIAHATLGHIDWAVASLLVVGTVAGAQTGAAITIGSSERRMQLLLGAFFLVVSVLFGGAELAAIAS